jgi:hypothetical protein
MKRFLLNLAPGGSVAILAAGLLLSCTSLKETVTEEKWNLDQTPPVTTSTTTTHYSALGNPKGFASPVVQHNTDVTAPGRRSEDDWRWLVLVGWITLGVGVALALGRHAIPIPYLTTLSISGCMTIIAVGVGWVFAPQYGPALTSMMLLIGGIGIIVVTVTTGSASNILTLFKHKKQLNGHGQT